MRNLLLKAALIPVLLSLLGLHTRPHGSSPGSTTHTDGTTHGDSGGPRRHPLTATSHADASGETRDRIGAARVRPADLPKNSGPKRDALNKKYEDDGRKYDEDLPEGWYRDGKNKVHNDDGDFAADPNVTDRGHNRDTEYPSNFSQDTHDKMAKNWTDQGRDLNAGKPVSIERDGKQEPLSLDGRGAIVDSNGNRVPREELTWRDNSNANNGDGNVIPYRDADGNTNLTYDHDRPVVKQWVDEGHAQPYGDRQRWYNNSENLVPMGRSENSSDGASLPWNYSDAAPDYANGYTSKYD